MGQLDSQSPSMQFLRKYWYVLLGVLLLVTSVGAYSELKQFTLPSLSTLPAPESVATTTMSSSSNPSVNTNSTTTVTGTSSVITEPVKADLHIVVPATIAVGDSVYLSLRLPDEPKNTVSYALFVARKDNPTHEYPLSPESNMISLRDITTMWDGVSQACILEGVARTCTNVKFAPGEYVLKARVYNQPKVVFMSADASVPLTTEMKLRYEDEVSITLVGPAAVAVTSVVSTPASTSVPVVTKPEPSSTTTPDPVVLVPKPVPVPVSSAMSVSIPTTVVRGKTIPIAWDLKSVTGVKSIALSVIWDEFTNIGRPLTIMSIPVNAQTGTFNWPSDKYACDPTDYPRYCYNLQNGGYTLVLTAYDKEEVVLMPGDRVIPVVHDEKVLAKTEARFTLEGEKVPE